ncbi:hypothetical protein [Leptolyngbya phage Lbo-JY46]
MTDFKVPSLNQLNNGVVIGQSRFDPRKFTDLNFLYTNYSKDSFTVYKGLLALWNQRSLVSTPILNATLLKNNVMYVPNTEGKFRYDVPYDLGLPVIVENLEIDNDKPGLDGQKFKIKLNEDCYTNTDRIIADYRDGIELYITEDEIYQEADGFVYTVEIVSNNRRGSYYPKEWLEPGTQYMKLSNINGEYDTQKSSISSEGLRTGIMNLEMELGGGHRSVTHWITGYADMARVDESKHPNLAFINQRLEGMGSTMLYYNVNPKTGAMLPKSLTWQPTIEALLRAEMELMTEKDLMWSKGGFVTGSGRRATRVGPGLYEQLRNGNRYQYNKISLTLIERAIANLFSKSGIPLEQRRTKIMTGTGGLIQVSKEIEEKYKQSVPFLTQVSDVPGGVLYGDQMNLGYKYRFTKFFSPIAGEIEFEINPALDSLNSNRIQDNFIGEYPIESYTYMIMDVTDSRSTNAAARVATTKYRVADGFNTNANIVLVKPENYGDLYWGYIAGTQSPLGPTAMKGMMSANQYDGYQIWMKAFANLWVKDVTRTLLIEKARPFYGGLFAQQ